MCIRDSPKVDHQNSAGINLSYSTPLDFWFAAVGLLDISELEMVVFHHARKLIHLPATLMALRMSIATFSPELKLTVYIRHCPSQFRVLNNCDSSGTLTHGSTDFLPHQQLSLNGARDHYHILRIEKAH